MSKLTVSPYTNQSVAQASGMRVTFDVTPPAEGVVYQNVHMIYHVGGDERTFRYAEAWRMTAAGKSCAQPGNAVNTHPYGVSGAARQPPEHPP